MNFKDFLTKFPDEESCQNFIKAKREADGISCRKCGCKNHYWRKKTKVWQCKKCDYRTSLKVGTVMENSNLDIRTWMCAFFLSTHTKKSYSTCEMKRLLGMSRFETVWYLMHRIRQFMSHENKKLFECGAFDHRPKLYMKIPVRRRIKKDDTRYIGVFINPESKTSSLLRGSSDLMLMIAASGDVLKEPEMDLKKKNRYPAIIKDRQRDYDFKIPEHEKSNYLPAWTLAMFQNLKAVLKGIHHLVDQKYIQLYIDEFSYKYNSRMYENPFESFLNSVFRRFG